tara:strand:+ start:3994 stop:5322 length:1329 start_codon:yes stop_codon:yes gene_type:complete
LKKTDSAIKLYKLTRRRRLKIGVLGMGYVGIQLAVAFGRKYETLGFDLDQEKIDSYRSGIDVTGEVSADEFRKATHLTFTLNPEELQACDVFIVAVPTPVDDQQRPDFTALIGASEIVGKILKPKAIVIYESTVYPGATEEICVPVLENQSGLVWKKDFHIGYSPERINPGDEEHNLRSIVKVVSADDSETLEFIAQLYSSIIDVGVHRASSIQIAEAAKVIENTQRDLNIALVNELAVIFDRLDIDMSEVLDVAGTKWNFLPFRPGLVGGHCIGVDPYYLTHKAEMIGYQPEVILAGRRINDNMGTFVGNKIIDELTAFDHQKASVDVNVLGVTFKENCTDFRNSQVFQLIKQLESTGLKVQVNDDLVDEGKVLELHDIELVPFEQLSIATVLVLAVPHSAYVSMSQDIIENLVSKPGLIIDIKAVLRNLMPIPEIRYWSL